MTSSRPPVKVGRRRRAAGWTLLTFGVLVAAAWTASGWWSISTRLGTHERFHVLSGGRFLVHTFPERYLPQEERGRRWHVVVSHIEEVGWDWRALKPRWRDDPLRDRPEFVVIDLGVLSYQNSREIAPAQGIWKFMLWPIPLLLWAPAALFLRSGILARRRAMSNACPKCGYLLAGLADGAACPECGKTSSPQMHKEEVSHG